MQSTSSSTVSSISPPKHGEEEDESCYILGSLLKAVNDIPTPDSASPPHHHWPSSHQGNNTDPWAEVSPPMYTRRCCSICGPRSSAVCLCPECGGDALCNECRLAHGRVKLTSGHALTNLFGSEAFEFGRKKMAGPIFGDSMARASSVMGTPNGSHSPPEDDLCSVHIRRRAWFACQTCVNTQNRACIECLGSAKGHAGHDVRLSIELRDRQEEKEFMDEMRAACHQMRDTVISPACSSVGRQCDRVDERVVKLQEELAYVFDAHRRALNERQMVLSNQLASIGDRKRHSLRRQYASLLDVARSLTLTNNTSNWHQAVMALHNAPNPLHLTPCESIDMSLAPLIDSSLLSSIKSMSGIRSSACAQLSEILWGSIGRAEGWERESTEAPKMVEKNIFVDRPLDVTMATVDYSGARMNRGGVANVAAHLTLADGHTTITSPTSTRQHRSLTIMDNQDGTYTTNVLIPAVGSYNVHILLDGQPVGNSPLLLHVRRVGEARDYAPLRHAKEPKATFGQGEISRPWGICCDVHGRVLVTDRSNNRICIYVNGGENQWRLMTSFGVRGAGNGQLNRPAGITTNSKNEIIVADKDNHRIQLFTSNGQFLTKFGEMGRAPRQFNYPWDVAVNIRDDIAVSDTRNHRVQLFDSTGKFLRKFGFDNNVFYKHFDSPRGLCFLLDGRLAVTDFNNHRLVVLNVQATTLHSDDNQNDTLTFAVGQGEVGHFNRPQGVTVDPWGNILVTDSRNHHMHVFSASLQPLCCFGRAIDANNATAMVNGWHHQSGPPENGHGPGPRFGNGANGSGSTGSRGAAPGSHIMDRPCDVACGPNGQVFVVDYGNDRICVY